MIHQIDLGDPLFCARIGYMFKRALGVSKI